MKKNIISFIFMAVSAAVVYFGNEFGFVRNFLKISPLLVGVTAGLTFLICLRFNKSRVSFMLALLLVWFFKRGIPGIAAVPHNEFMTFIALNIVYLASSSERGVFSIHGLKKVVIITAQLGLLYCFTVYNNFMYLKSENIVIRAAYFLTNLPYDMFPFFLLFTAAVQNIVRGGNYDIPFAVGAVAGLAALGTALSELNMLAVLVMMFIGALASIYTISYVDELTGLPGRRAFNEYIATLGSRYAIALSDIDHFKKFNDTYGHETGDEVLKLVAKTLSTVGGGGKTFRLGGEEFVIAFNGKTREHAAGHLEDIRKKIANTPFTVRDRKSRKKFKKTGVKTKTTASRNIRITMSFGASDSSDDRNPSKVLREADAALYKSKKRGRNRVTV